MFNTFLFSSIVDSLGEVQDILNTGTATVPGPTNTTPTLSNYDQAFAYEISLPAASQVPTKSSYYKGSLSSHGCLVAMQINKGTYNYIKLPGNNPENLDANGNPKIVIKPYLTGYLREYWRDPLQITLGENSAIPAITGVMPVTLSKYSKTPGSALYYLDLQMTRLSGSNFFDNKNFIINFNRKYSYLTYTQNTSTPDVFTQNIVSNDISSYRQTTYTGFISGGFNIFKQGVALREALFNIGTMVQQIPSNHFGTPNAVAQHMLDSNLGSVGNLRTKLIEANVNLNDIYLSRYSDAISMVLKTITNVKDLVTIQNVIKSSIPNITSPFDYTSLEKCAGLPNDSVFPSFIEAGQNLYSLLPSFNVETGKQLYDLINLFEFDNSLNYLSDNGLLVPPAVLDSVSDIMLFAPDGSKATLYNVIGCATGYLIAQLKIVNDQIDKLNNSKFGASIHQALNNISLSYNNYRTEYLNQGNYQNSLTSFLESISNYENLLKVVSLDPETQNIVTELNKNWSDLCEHISYEVINYNRDVNPLESSDPIDTEIANFPTAIKFTYYKDEYGLKSDIFLKDMAQPNQGGNAAKNLINYYKNQDLILLMGGKI